MIPHLDQVNIDLTTNSDSHYSSNPRNTPSPTLAKSSDVHNAYFQQNHMSAGNTSSVKRESTIHLQWPRPVLDYTVFPIFRILCRMKTGKTMIWLLMGIMRYV
jgi:hypothetical protein